jgi:adenylate cyclase
MTNTGTWTLTIRSPDGEPIEYVIRPGRNSIGRSSKNDIIVTDVSASREHANIHFDQHTNIITIHDLDSTNGTFINRNRLTTPYRLSTNDIIRIGMCLMNLNFYDTKDLSRRKEVSGTRPLTRELMIESFDQHAVLMYEVASQLNSVFDLNMARSQLSSLLQRSMGTDKCEVIPAEQFDKLHEYGFPISIAAAAINQKTAISIPDLSAETDPKFKESASLMRIRSALCVPVVSGDEVLALIYMYKTDPQSRPFNQQDVKLAVAISHLASLTIQRVRLLTRVQEEQKSRLLLQRFLAPSEIEDLLNDYLKTGHLPGLAKHDVTVLFTDIVDSTGLAERLGTLRFGDLLAHYYNEMTDIVFNHGGLINKYLGDGIMALFGMTGKDQAFENHALLAGLEMLERAKKYQTREDDHFQIGVGVNTGPVMAGYIETKERIEFAALGDTVNVASSLAELSKPNRLFIGNATFEAISKEFVTRQIGEINIKGRLEPTKVYEAISN